MIVPHTLFYVLSTWITDPLREPYAYLHEKGYWLFWTIKDPGHFTEVSNVTPVYNFSTVKPTFEPEWYNETTYNETLYNRTAYINGSDYWPSYFKYECVSRWWIDARFSCFWAGKISVDCPGYRSSNRITRRYCPKECGRCPTIYLQNYKQPPADTDDRHGKKIEDKDNPCNGAKLALLDPVHNSVGDIYMSTKTARWKEAFHCCKINGFELLAGTDMKRLRRYFQDGEKDMTWVFANDASMENNWVWPSRKMISKYFFHKNQPDNANNGQNCGAVFFWNKKFRMDDRDCDEQFRFMCVQKTLSTEYYFRSKDRAEFRFEV